MLYMSLYHFNGTNCALMIKELLRNFQYYKSIIGGRKNKEILELGLELCPFNKSLY